MLKTKTAGAENKGSLALKSKDCWRLAVFPQGLLPSSVKNCQFYQQTTSENRISRPNPLIWHRKMRFFVTPNQHPANERLTTSFATILVFAAKHPKKRPTKIGYFGHQNSLFWSAKQPILLSRSLVSCQQNLSFGVKKSGFWSSRPFVLLSGVSKTKVYKRLFPLERRLGKC